MSKTVSRRFVDDCERRLDTSCNRIEKDKYLLKMEVVA